MKDVFFIPLQGEAYQILQTLQVYADTIARQHSEFSGFAQRMAAQWRKGELKAWR
jgi:hypothetical protein